MKAFKLLRDMLLTVPEKIPSNSVATHFKSIPMFEFEDVLSQSECSQVIHHFSKQKSYDVGVQGINNDDGIGSKRVSSFDIGFAEFLDKKLKAAIESKPDHPLSRTYKVDTFSNVYANHDKWKYVCISPYFRYMKYNKEGKHFTHYDSPYSFNDKIQTLFSGVLYLTTNDSCATVFIDDEQNHLPLLKRNLSDWTDHYLYDQVICESFPVAGKVILFEHQHAHAVSELLKDEDRIIIRFDVYFTKA